MEIGDRLALVWGSSACKAIVKAKTDDRYLIYMDWGGREIMDEKELIRREFVILPESKSIFEKIFG